MFTKDSRTEVFLTQMGAEFRYTNNVTFSDLAPGWDVKNIARPTAKREDAILEYATLMESGSPAPATILAVTQEGHQVLDGVQRLCAAQFGGATKFSAYLVMSDSDDLLDSIRVLANLRLQGRQEPPEWTKRRAVEVLVIQRKKTPEEVARLGGWTASEVARLANVMDFGFQIRCIGGPQLPDSVIEVVAKHVSKDDLRKFQKPTAKFLNTLKDGKFSADDAEEIVTEYFAPAAKPTHDLYEDRLASIVDKPEVEARIKGRRGYSVPPEIRLLRTMKSVQTIADELTEEPVYVDEFFRLLRAIEKKLKSLSSHSKTPESPRVPADKWSKA